jgi:hypothetical protein
MILTFTLSLNDEVVHHQLQDNIMRTLEGKPVV